VVIRQRIDLTEESAELTDPGDLGAAAPKSKDRDGQKEILAQLPVEVRAKTKFLLSAHYAFNVGTVHYRQAGLGRNPDELFNVGVHRVACYYIRNEAVWPTEDKCYCAQDLDTGDGQHGVPQNTRVVLPCESMSRYIGSRYFAVGPGKIPVKCMSLVRGRGASPPPTNDAGVLQLNTPERKQWEEMKYRYRFTFTPETFDPLVQAKQHRACDKEP
jgi:hypothetical protein